MSDLEEKDGETTTFLGMDWRTWAIIISAGATSQILGTGLFGTLLLFGIAWAIFDDSFPPSRDQIRSWLQVEDSK